MYVFRAVCFFFSSRRRHTRLQGDWSSDVCSSDLRPFAVVLLDLDGLKKVNDRHGHLVGSRALCRVAEVLHGSCRGVDTAARFGGDEFAVVLPETGEDAAWLVARRVGERVARDGEKPAITVSVGVAGYPRGGMTLEAPLSSAGQGPYQSKAPRQAESRAR